MIPLRLDELPQLGELDARADEITGVKIDSRKVEPGDLFVALGRGVVAVRLLGLAVREVLPQLCLRHLASFSDQTKRPQDVCCVLRPHCLRAAFRGGALSI